VYDSLGLENLLLSSYVALFSYLLTINDKIWKAKSIGKCVHFFTRFPTNARCKNIKYLGIHLMLSLKYFKLVSDTDTSTALEKRQHNLTVSEEWRLVGCYAVWLL
jgi:hypothetical protein